MDVFSQIPQAMAIILVGGSVYRQVDLYERKGKVFCRHGGGYIRLLAHAKTSHPKVNWVEYEPGDSIIVAGANGVEVWNDKGTP